MRDVLRTSPVAGRIAPLNLRRDSGPGEISCRSNNELRAGTSSILQVRTSETAALRLTETRYQETSLASSSISKTR